MKPFKEWRAEELVKLFLLKYEQPLEVNAYPLPGFDFFVKSKNNPDVTFFVEVKSSSNFSRSFKQLKTVAKTYEMSGALGFPLLVFKVDDVAEKGDFCFLTLKNDSGKYVVVEQPEFHAMSNGEFSKALDEIKAWSKVKKTT